MPVDYEPAVPAPDVPDGESSHCWTEDCFRVDDPKRDFCFCRCSACKLAKTIERIWSIGP